MIGQKLAQYRITGKLGEGGMGVVYQARDDKLERDLAVKVLSADLLHDPVARTRLIREAQAAASLNHPNVCTIYEVGESAGQFFIAMELVEGRTLSKLLESGPLSTEQVLRFGFQLADALGHAHERGLVHRDLKCLNVIVTSEGRCKVLDFGLARRLSESVVNSNAETALTQPGSVLGTPAYMAPEQLQGDTSDARSDVWALGVMLYEMATGSRPFQGNTDYAVSSAILTSEPAALPAKVPVALRAVVERCLNKEPQNRYRDAREVRSVFESIREGTAGSWNLPYSRLRRKPVVVAILLLAASGLVGIAYNNSGSLWRGLTRSAAPEIRSVAVLPLDNNTGDPANDFLADGMTDALISKLARFGDLRVIARASMMKYKGRNISPADVAKELNVEGVITGSVVTSLDEVGVSITLINPFTGEVLGSADDRRSLRDVFTLHNTITSEIIQVMRVTMTQEERLRLATSRQVDPEAYQAFTKGMISWYRHTPEEIDRAYDYFQQAIKIDPEYAEAYGGLAWIWVYRASAELSPNEIIKGWEELGGMLAKKGLNLDLDTDTTQAEYYEAGANADFYYAWKWEAAEKKYRTAIQRKPNSVDLRLFFWNLLAATKRIPEARTLLERGLELDPHNPLAHGSYALLLLLARDFDKAIAQSKKMLNEKTDFGVAHLSLWSAYHHTGRRKEAFEEAKLAFASHEILLESLLEGYKEGGYAGAMRSIGDQQASHSRFTYVLPTNIARSYAYAGDKEKTLQWLTTGFEDRDSGLVTIQVDPDWDLVRDDPRFLKIVKDMNFPR